MSAAQRLRDAIGIVGAKATPEETDSYKTFVMTVAQAVASARKEGGFLGIGGKQVTEPKTKRSTRSPAPWDPPPAA